MMSKYTTIQSWLNTIQYDLREHKDNIDSEIENMQSATMKILEMDAKVVKTEKTCVKEKRRMKQDLEEAESVDELRRTFVEPIL